MKDILKKLIKEHKSQFEYSVENEQSLERLLQKAKVYSDENEAKKVIVRRKQHLIIAISSLIGIAIISGLTYLKIKSSNNTHIISDNNSRVFIKDLEQKYISNLQSLAEDIKKNEESSDKNFMKEIENSIEMTIEDKNLISNQIGEDTPIEEQIRIIKEYYLQKMESLKQFKTLLAEAEVND